MPFLAEQAAGRWEEYHADNLSPVVKDKDKNERIGDASIAIRVYSVTPPLSTTTTRHRYTHIYKMQKVEVHLCQGRSR